MDVFYIVYLNSGETSPRLETVPDVAIWIENNMTEKTGHASIKRNVYDRKKAEKEIQTDMQKLEQRMNKLQAKLALVQSKASATA